MPNWNQVLSEIRQEDTKLRQSAVSAVDKVRRRYLKRLHTYTKRNVIAYYSGWLSSPNAPGIEINDEDKNAFMMAIHGVDTSLGLDLILHTPGGGIAAAESLVDYLRRMFGSDIRAIVPQLAMSAGTMVACSCKSIVLAKHSNLGPIDPQIMGLPAAAVKKEIEAALDEIKRDPDAIKIWQFVLNKYNPTFIGQCEQAVIWAKEFVEKSLRTNMFLSDQDRDAKVAKIVDALSDISVSKSHSRHFHVDECVNMGLKVEKLEDDQELQDRLLTVHHCYIHSLGSSNTVKIVENHNGSAFMKYTA